MTMLSLKSVHASVEGRAILHGISLDVAPGEFVGLIGPNGAGKTTLLRSILGLMPASGEIAIGGADARHMNAQAQARHIAYLPQDRDIAWPVSVEMVVSLGRAPHRPSFAALNEQDKASIERAIQRMELQNLRCRAATDLSGGEKARVLIARALAQDAPCLLADEPVAGLDPAHQLTLMQCFADLAAEGRSVVASLHDLGLAARWCTRLVVLDQGRVIADGAPSGVLTGELLASVYGIEAHISTVNGQMMVQPTRVVSGR
ncbi:MAG: ABC transporter ATP-binding protein [Phyllobacterium sp.]